MNRIIKFRAWDKSSKVIRKVSNINWFDELIYLDEKPSGEVERRAFDDVDLMQFTGLLDKNGTEIYEGDIVKCGVAYPVGYHRKLNQILGHMVWNNDGYWIIEPAKGMTEGSWQMEWEDAVICGNIYENPELLKEVK